MAFTVDDLHNGRYVSATLGAIPFLPIGKAIKSIYIPYAGGARAFALSEKQLAALPGLEAADREAILLEVASAKTAKEAEQILAKAKSAAGRARALLGRSAEEAVAKFTGIELNRGVGRDIVAGTGPGGFRVPDLKVFGPAASIAARGSIIEVKNVTRLYASRQLRDLVKIAEDFGCTVEIFTNATLPKDGELARWIKQGIVKIQPIP